MGVNRLFGVSLQNPVAQDLGIIKSRHEIDHACRWRLRYRSQEDPQADFAGTDECRCSVGLALWGYSGSRPGGGVWLTAFSHLNDAGYSFPAVSALLFRSVDVRGFARHDGLTGGLPSVCQTNRRYCSLGIFSRNLALSRSFWPKST